MPMSKREEWAAEHGVQLPPEDDIALTKFHRRVQNATVAHSELERLVQVYHNMPTKETAESILSAAQKLRDAWSE